MVNVMCMCSLYKQHDITHRFVDVGNKGYAVRCLMKLLSLKPVNVRSMLLMERVIIRSYILEISMDQWGMIEQSDLLHRVSLFIFQVKLHTIFHTSPSI